MSVFTRCCLFLGPCLNCLNDNLFSKRMLTCIPNIHVHRLYSNNYYYYVIYGGWKKTSKSFVERTVNVYGTRTVVCK